MAFASPVLVFHRDCCRRHCCKEASAMVEVSSACRAEVWRDKTFCDSMTFSSLALSLSRSLQCDCAEMLVVVVTCEFRGI